jgi:hypothetical protein
LKKKTYLSELDDRKLLVASISQRSEEVRFCSPVNNFTISNPSLKAVFSILQGQGINFAW